MNDTPNKAPRDPKTGQLLPGAVLNPKGRPTGIGLSDLMRHILEEPIDKRSKKTKAEKFIESMLEDAYKGDPTARKLIMNYIEGLPKQSINVVHHVPKNVVDALRLAYNASFNREIAEAQIVDIESPSALIEAPKTDGVLG